MAPAPKSRVPKGKIVEEPPMATPMAEGELVDLDGTSSPTSKPDIPRRRSSVEAPPPRFQLRRPNADGHSKTSDIWFTQRGATDEIREHLKHLGPSNLASRPRQTRYHNVKIKRSGESPARSAQTDIESGHSLNDSQLQINSTAYQGGIGAGLVGSGADAKDGAHALKLGYGTMSPQESVTKATNAQQFKDLPQVSIPEPVREEREDQTRQNSSGTGSIRSTESRTEFIYHHRGPTRSGSITEQIVDVNGIRKVVLHTNGSGSSSEDQTSPHDTRDSSPNRQHAIVDTIHSNPEHQGHQNPHSKKRRRRKHGKIRSKQDGSSEEQPLLHQ